MSNQVINLIYLEPFVDQEVHQILLVQTCGTSGIILTPLTPIATAA